MGWQERAERCYERAQVSYSGEPHNGHLMGNIVWGVLAVIFKILFRYTARGLSRVRETAGKSGALIVCDHVSYSDPIFHYLVIRPKQWPRFMAKSDMMRGFVGWFLGMHGAFPVDRDSADFSAIKRGARFLKAGEVVALFPEGTRRGKGNVQLKIHAGVALVARMAKVPVFPSTVYNADMIKRNGERLRFPKVTVIYGDPLYLDDFTWIPKKERMEAFSWYAMRECYALKQGVPSEEVDMPALFPADHDFTPLFASWKPGMEPPVGHNGQPEEGGSR